MKKAYIAIGAVIALILIGAVAYLGLNLKQAKTEKAEMQELMELDRMEMENEYRGFTLQYDELRNTIQNDTLAQQLNAERQRAQQLLEELQRVKANDANYVAEIKRIKNDPNCTIVGIDGGWGIGKSNLVGMVENMLTGTTSSNELGKYYFFTYDAWGHQNDYPRRTIMEELTSEITSGDNPFLESNDWKDLLDNLLAKKKRISTKTVPRLNFALIVLALMTALTPVVAAISDTITSSGWRIVFTVSVYAAFVGFVIWKQRDNMHKHGQTINAENFFTELFLLYKDKIKAC